MPPRRSWAGKLLGVGQGDRSTDWRVATLLRGSGPQLFGKMGRGCGGIDQADPTHRLPAAQGGRF